MSASPIDAPAVKPRGLQGATLTRRRSVELMPPTDASKSKSDPPFDASLAATRKHEQLEKLWEMFATYALLISSEDPTRMRVKNVCKLLQDCGVIDGSNSDAARMVEKEVNLVCDSFLKLTPSDRDNTKRMDFTAFLGLLMHFARMSDDQDPALGFDSLVRTCLEKQQKPRVRTPVADEMHACKKVLQAFDEPLAKLFLYFATISHAKLEKLDRKMAQLSPPHMGYGECLAFARTYGIIAHGVLTTTEFATIYIDSLTKAPAFEYERVLAFDGFCELMVRVSRRACPGDHSSAEQKLKGLFQLMWLASSSMSPRALKITDVLKTDKVDVAKLFLLHFEKFWKRENYENYVGDRAAPATLGLDNSVTSCMHLDGRALTSVSLPGAPVGSPMRRGHTKRLSLCVQTSAAVSATGGQPQLLHRRCSIQTPPSP